MADANAKRVNLIGGDGENYLGVLEPPLDGGRWAWPFKQMEPGQYFRVNHEDRPPEDVRQLAHVRAGLMGYSISVAANDPEAIGYCRVTYVDKTKAKTEDRHVTWAGFDKLLQRHYGITYMNVSVTATEPGYVGYRDMVTDPDKNDVPIRPIKQIEKPRFDRFILEDYEFHYGIEFREDAIISHCLRKGTQIEQWEATLDYDPFA